MDKIIRRVRMAERNVARRAKRREYALNGGKRRQSIEEIGFLRKQAGAELGAAIKARHEDLELGPLAPKRDIPKPDRFNNYWGSISPDRATLSPKLSDAQKEARGAWAGGSKLLCLAVGDRVVITEGAYKGQISTISSITKANMSVELDGNVGIVRSPPYIYVWRHRLTHGNRRTSGYPISSSRKAKRTSSKSRNASPSRPSGSYTRSKTRRPARPATSSSASSSPSG